MTDTEYKIMAVHIARHCMNHLRFVYDSEFNFGDFTLRIKVRYNAGRRFWLIRPDKFKINHWTIKWEIPDCTRPVHFDPDILLHYLN